MGGSASFDWSPRVQLHSCSCTRVAGGKGDSNDTEEGTGWGKKGIEGLTFPKEQSQLYLVNLIGTETQEIIPVAGLAGGVGPKRANLLLAWDTSRTVVALLQW